MKGQRLSTADTADFSDLPGAAAWQHHHSRTGFEVVVLTADAAGIRLDGATAAVEDGEPWWVRYRITLDSRWRTRAAEITGGGARSTGAIQLASDGEGRWRVDGRQAPALDGCLDLDLESSCCTNTIPVHRLRLAHGDSAAPPAAFVRASTLAVTRLEQSYLRLGDEPDCSRYLYTAPAFEFEATLRYDRAGLILEYPGIGSRAC